MDQPIIEEEPQEKKPQLSGPMDAQVKVQVNESAMKEEEVPVKVEIKEGVNGYVEEVRIGEETLFSLPPEMQ